MSAPVAEAIVLAGGLGTRLRPIVADLPKPLASIAGRPFLDWMLADLARKGMRRIILATGYGSEAIEARYGSGYLGMAVAISRESEPLGTGGAIRRACSLAMGDQIVVLNGDTYATWAPLVLQQASESTGCPITLVLKEMASPDRYGTVTLDRGRVVAFAEKRPMVHGIINAGIYLLRHSTMRWPAVERFSFERDVLEVQCCSGAVAGVVMGGPMIDIGMPESYAEAQTLIPQWLGS